MEDYHEDFNEKDYGEFFDDFSSNESSPKSNNEDKFDYSNDDFSERKNINNNQIKSANFQNRKVRVNPNKVHNVYPKGRKGLKWQLISLCKNKIARLVAVLAVMIIIIAIIVSSCNSKTNASTQTESSTLPTNATTAATKITSYQIKGVPVIAQGDLHAACETYACTMLLQSYHFDINEYQFVDNYLITKPVSYDSDGTMYGPDMNSAYAGDIYTGYGIFANGMAKCMNNYIKTTKSKLVAYPLYNIPLKELCEKYVLNDIPVMVWATTYMDEPYVKATWVVNYADSDSPVKVGDTMSWQMHEHCMVLIGFDSKNYYFCDSVSGKVSAYDIATSEKRYEQIGKQAIILK